MARLVTYSVTGAPALRARTQPPLGQTMLALGYAMVPLQKTGENHLFLFGRVDGRKRSCLVDTGWSFTTVSTNTAARLTATNLVARLELGPAAVTNLPVVVSDLRVNGQPTSYDVVLGCEFLQRHQALVDCRSGRLFLRAPGAAPAERPTLEAALTNGGWTAIELQQRSPPALTCTVTVNGQVTQLLVDSGAMWSCLDEHFAASAGLPLLNSPRRMSGPAASRPHNLQVTDLKIWTLGHVAMRERTLAVLDLAGWGLGKKGKIFPEVNGILGGAELQAGEALIDCGSGQLWWRRRAPAQD